MPAVKPGKVTGRVRSLVEWAANRRDVAIIAAALALIELCYIIYLRRPLIIGLDFSSYYTWAFAIRRHLNPYRGDLTPLASRLGLSIGTVLRTNYPPTTLLLFEQFVKFRPIVAYWIWISLSAVLFVAALTLMLTAELPMPLAAIAAVFAISYLPVDIHFVFAQIQIPLLFLFVLVMRELRQNRQDTAGSILALAGLLKIFPMLLIIYFVSDRRWKGVACAGLVFVFGFVLSMLLMGRDALDFFGAFVRTALPGHGAPILPIVSIPGAYFRFYEFFSTKADIRAHHLGSLTFVSTLTNLLVLALALRAALRLRERGKSLEPAFGLLITTTVLVTPIAWPHYMVLLLIPLAQLAFAAYRGTATRLAIALGIAAYLLADVAIELSRIEYYVYGHQVLADQISEGLFWSVVLTFAASYVMILQDSRREPSTDTAALTQSSHAASPA
ncbi:MAG TPA: glycosyltransferase family 87 protein [Candidatus Binataceae bacterium]|nr:glycosyltransferase family 87 protein [Candidatus Binataceae bacterium]